MVLVSDKKYACETCIKGHRSSACKHTDRPLFEIKKKGRPVTQCEHCRELRKTKQVHVKCLCGVQDVSSHLVSDPSHTKKGATKLPAVAAFPHGLPEDLEAIATLPVVSDGSVESDHSGETSPSGCRCNRGDPCDCFTLRKPSGRRRSSVHHQDAKAEKHLAHHLHHAEPHGVPGDSPSPLSSHVLARIAVLRPVLPRPPRNDGPLHDPSSNIPHSHSSRHHTHENMYFSPYSRAYEHVHTPEHHETKPASQMGDTRASPVRHQPPLQRGMLPGTPSAFDAWQGASSGDFPSACTCGDSCRCPGCSQHSNSPIAPGGAYAACASPGSCSFCLDCTILSLPPSSAPPSIDFTSDSQSREFEEWLRQISTEAAPATTAVGMPATFSPYELSMNPMAAFPTQIPNANSNSNSSSPPHTRPTQHPSSADARCHGRCSCPSGQCSCSPPCCGCCRGCECGQRCSGHTGSGSGTRSPTYALSGERNACCSPLKPPESPSANAGVSRRPGSLRVPDYMTMTTVRDGLTASVVNRPSPVGPSSGAGTGSFYTDPPNYLSVGDAPSRSSSSSSLSSRMSGRSPIGTNPSGVFHAHGLGHGASNVNVGPSARSPQARPTITTGTSVGAGAYAQPQPTRPLGSMSGQYNAYPAFGAMQFPPQ